MSICDLYLSQIGQVGQIDLLQHQLGCLADQQVWQIGQIGLLQRQLDCLADQQVGPIGQIGTLNDSAYSGQAHPVLGRLD